MAKILDVDESAVLEFSIKYDDTSSWGRMKFTSEVAERVLKDRKFRLTLSYIKDMTRIMYSAAPSGDGGFLVRSM